MYKKIGVIAMFNISSPGGAPRVVIDLINSLNEMGKSVHLLTPFELNYEKIKNFYGGVKVEKVHSLGEFKKFFARGRAMPRKLMKKKFIQMAKEVDFIIDIDGGIFHRYLPVKFDNSKYVIWRISCVKPESERLWIKRGFKGKIKEVIKNIFGESKCIPSKSHKIYSIDKWTAKELKDYWNVNSENIYLYPEIKVERLVLKGKREKKNQIVIFGRIAPNKSVEESVKIFAIGTRNFPDYKLIIMGGATADTPEYSRRIRELAKELGVLNRIEIIQSPSFEQLKKILQESKIIIDSQKEINLTMTSIEAMAAGNVVLGYKNSGGYLDILDNGKLGYGFLTVEEGGKKLDLILKKLENGKIKIDDFIKRAQDFGKERFIKTLKRILGENDL
ncbi:MAG: glycosyltransferase family 4 protein [Nanoarchaeota archaeon]